ncbi:MAG: flagellar motor protein MotB [Syntrophorhabdaceae bacterium]|nr:flagellar motor protein MotB [Syntrophorhabdaceae bacterium]MDD5245417.1 flagellar motor protein MotB [Syntrophorhabdaceae bacterium]
MRKKRTEEEHENLERWLITYADLITLLLAFFIMMYTFSKQDTQKYQELTGHLKTIFTGNSGITGKGNGVSQSVADIQSRLDMIQNGDVKRQLEDEIKGMMNNKAMQKNISVLSDERGIVIRILDKAFFDEGRADLKERARKALGRIMPVMRKVDNHIRIEGHTDDVPIKTSEFKSNWELSVRRATEVVRYFVEKHDFPPQRISAVGYAEYRPIVANDTPDNRAMNRRIEIILMK